MTRRNVYVRSRKAGERVMAFLRRCYAKLRLKRKTPVPGFPLSSILGAPIFPRRDRGSLRLRQAAMNSTVS